MLFQPDEWHNVASGRIFILGCGPSLLGQIDLLPRLDEEATMTCNGTGKWDALPFKPTYHCTTDIPRHKWLEDVIGSWEGTDRFAFQRQGEEPHEAYYIVPTDHDGVQVFSYGMAGMGDQWENMRTARTTPLTIAQLAWWMGYREFYYLGIEQTRGYAWNPEQSISVTGRAEFPLDKSPKYLYAIQRCAKRMREEIEASGGHIYDCTPQGFLNETYPYPQTENSATQLDILEYKELSEVL